MPTVNMTLDVNAIANESLVVIAKVQHRNATLRSQPTPLADPSYLGHLVSQGMGIRSAHGNRQLSVFCDGVTKPTVYDIQDFPNLGGSIWRYSWMHYARGAATDHARGGIPTLIEFNGGLGQGGARILYEYVRNCFVYTPDHYTTMYLVTQNGVPVRG